LSELGDSNRLRKFIYESSDLKEHVTYRLEGVLECLERFLLNRPDPQGADQRAAYRDLTVGVTGPGPVQSQQCR
jgi:hypothetical protein